MLSERVGNLHFVAWMVRTDARKRAWPPPDADDCERGWPRAAVRNVCDSQIWGNRGRVALYEHGIVGVGSTCFGTSATTPTSPGQRMLIHGFTVSIIVVLGAPCSTR